MPHILHQNKTENRFEVRIEDKIAFVDYKLGQKTISFLHTEVPKELGGKGIGSFLAKGVLDYASNNELKVKPYCPFIKAYINKHQEYQEISEFY